MSKQPNKKMIGIYTFSGILIFLLILFFFLQNKIYSGSKNEVVMYFEESISGLNVGSPVVFMGVKIGEVSRIKIDADTEDLSFSIPVYARMHTRSLDATKQFSSGKEVMDALVAKGLRARLVPQSYITGQLMIELELYNNAPIKYHQRSDETLEIPTVLSSLGEISKGLQKLPVGEGVKNFSSFFEQLNNTMPRINQIVVDIESILQRNKNTSTELLENFNKAMQNVAKAAKSLQNLTDYLEQHPEALLKGKK